MSAERLELSTNGLKGHCSTIELRAHSKADCILSWASRIVNVIDEGLAASKVCGGKMSEVNYVKEDNFQNEVLNADKPVLVDFTAVWCPPCKMIDPIVKQLAQDWDGKVKVVKLDADENPNILMQFGVLGIPTLLLFKGGQVQERVTGYQPKEKLLTKLNPHI
jgi:thioredoxin 1